MPNSTICTTFDSLAENLGQNNINVYSIILKILEEFNVISKCITIQFLIYFLLTCMSCFDLH